LTVILARLHDRGRWRMAHLARLTALARGSWRRAASGVRCGRAGHWRQLPAPGAPTSAEAAGRTAAPATGGRPLPVSHLPAIFCRIPRSSPHSSPMLRPSWSPCPASAWTRRAALVTAGDNPGRLRSERSFARLCGVAPVPVSSGRTDRHRLYRGGDRDASSAFWRIALVRMHCHQPTRDYLARRTAEGRTKKEILRCLKRYIAREVYGLLRC